MRRASQIRSFALVCLFAIAAGNVALAASLERASPRSVGFSPERLERLSSALKAYVDDGQLAGSVTLVARRGKVAYFEAFGSRDREANAPMRTDAIFRIASQSKAIVSVAAMTLVEEGELQLTDPVGKYLPEFQTTTVAQAREGGGYDVVKAHRPITVRDLLTHTFRDGYGNGLGFYVVEDVGARGSFGSEGEFGWGGAYHTTYWVDPHEQLVVVHLTQLVPAGNVDDQNKVRTLIYQAIAD